MELAPIYELGELQWNALLFMALGTSDAEERIDLGRRRRSITRSSSSRYLGFIFTTQGAARATLCRCRQRSHQRGILRFVFTTAGTAASPLLHLCAGVKMGITSIRHPEAALGEKEKP
jgi:hypothetical protein